MHKALTQADYFGAQKKKKNEEARFLPPHFFCFLSTAMECHPAPQLTERRASISGILRLESTKRNEGALFDQKERSGDKKPRNNASSFLFLIISGVFQPNNASTFPR
jgi:hypothetical protein